MNLTPENATDAPAAPAADATSVTPILDHERLDVYRVTLEFAAMVPALTKSARPAMRDQLERASSSIQARPPPLAHGSAAECAAGLDVLRALGHVDAADATRAKHKLARIVQMLVGLRRA